MKTKISIMNYDCYAEWDISAKGSNHSSIVTKMIQLAGRFCERFASDIVYDANAFIEAIDNKQNFDRYLFFRECGVSSFPPDYVQSIEGTDFIQAWHLTYDAETEQQALKRVSVYFERVW